VGATAAVAVMRRKEREVRSDFHAVGATTPVNAMSLSAIGLDETRAVKRLKKHAVIREASPGLFYFDDDVWEALCGMRRRMAILLVGTIVLVGLMVLYGVVAF
jgi:hypothetical protein